jgi:hypothetical protein
MVPPMSVSPFGGDETGGEEEVLEDVGEGPPDEGSDDAGAGGEEPAAP